jgi:hypothetical protein
MTTDNHIRPDGAQEAAVTALRMLTDGTRLRLLWLLHDGETRRRRACRRGRRG